MTTSPTDVRVRRPQQHETLMVELRDEAAFSTFRDILLFAAAVGVHFNRRITLTSAAGDPIRYETLTGPAFSEALVNMIAASEAPDDPEIMDSSRLEERIKIFEEYANGGLEYIQEQVNVRHQTADLVAIALVTEALSASGGAKPVSVDELLSGVSWS
jgi:dnd system-associated protein 4